MIETHLSQTLGIRVHGGKELFSARRASCSQEPAARERCGWRRPRADRLWRARSPSARRCSAPAVPHRGMFYVLSKLKLTVSGDIGCYTLGAPRR